MSQNKDHIYGVLDLFTQASVLDEPERGAGFHIFFDLRNNYHARLTFAENLSLFYHYKSFEKCLGLMRKRELKTSELIFNEIHESGLDYPFFLKDGMVSLFFAMLGVSLPKNTPLADMMRPLPNCRRLLSMRNRRERITLFFCARSP